MKRYSHLLFDADNTLFDFKKSSRKAFRAMMNHHDIEDRDSHYKLYNSFNISVWTQFENGEIDAVTLRSKRFKLFFDKLEMDVDPVTANLIYLENLANLPIMIEGAMELLDSLRSNRSLSIITNGLREVQRKRIQNAGITDYFETIVVSDEIGIAKPDKAYFNYTMDKLGNPSSDGVLVIGDSLSSDIKGGSNAGIDTCWYNPYNKDKHSGIEPTYMVGNLSEIHNHI